MVDINISQADADALIAMEKIKVGDERWTYPSFGGSISIPLVSTNKREHFILDISRSKINLQKGKYQNRAKQVIILVRLDFGGQPHRNPDGLEIPSPHIHIYKEGYGDKWALPVQDTDFPNMSDLWQVLEDFMRYCNIIEPPLIDRGLFI